MSDDKKELIQHLFNASNTDKNFQKRFQSFLDQIPKPSGASAAPEKEGFFINLFLGMFASLKSTELAIKLGLQNLYFREVQVVGKELHVIAEVGPNKKKHLFIFVESNSKKSEDDLKKEIKNIGEQVQSNATKVLIGRKILEGEEIKKEKDQKWKFKVLVEHKEGTDRVITEGFKEVNYIANENLEDSIAKLATDDLKDSRRYIEKIIEKSKRLYSNLKGKNLIQNSHKEAAQHGFISGMLMNFRYRYNLKLYLELLTGRGYSDIILLIREKNRFWLVIPIVMELKAEGNVDNALSEAQSYARGLRRNKMRLLTNADKAICVGVNLNQPKDSYKISEVASEIKRNQEPIMQSLFNIVYSDGNNEGKVNEIENLLGQLYYTFPSEQYTRDYLSRFLLGQLPLVKKPKGEQDIKIHVFNHSEENIKSCFTTYIFVVKGQNQKSKVFVFHIHEGGTQQSGYNRYTFTEDAITKDPINLSIEQIEQLTLVHIVGYKEIGPSQSAPSPGSFYKNQDLVKIENKDPKEYFVGAYPEGRQIRSNTPKNKFKGKVELVNMRPKLINEFKKAIDYQQKELEKKIEEKKHELGHDHKFELDAYTNLFDAIKGLMCDEQSKPKQYLISMLSSENRFKAFLDGLFTGLSDLDKDRVIAVLTEFQVGGGGRIDIMIQVVDTKNPNGQKKIEELKKSVSVGFELKYSETTTAARQELTRANNQIKGYAESKNIKSITEGDNVVFIGVVFNSKASNSDELILVSEKFVAAGVSHSSTHVSLRSQLSSTSVASGVTQAPSTSR